MTCGVVVCGVQVCAVRVIAESEWVQEFLTEGEESCTSPVELKVLLPDRSVVAVAVARSANADHVYRAVCDKIALDAQLRPYFYLFEIVEYNFGRCFLMYLLSLNIFKNRLDIEKIFHR